MSNDLILSPIIQYGFLGFSAVLLVILVWLITQLLRLQKETNQIISRNAQAIERLNTSLDDVQRDIAGLHDRLISRPCIAKFEQRR